MNTLRKIIILVCFVGFFVFCWFAYKSVEKSRVSELKKEVRNLKNVQLVFDHTVSLLTEEQKKTFALAAQKYFDSQRTSSVESEEIDALFKIPKNEDEKIDNKENVKAEEKVENGLIEKKES